MEMVHYQLLLGSSSYQDSLKLLEADIHHANALAAAIPKQKGGGCIEMKLVYNQFAPLLFLLLQWFDGSCSCFFPFYFNLFHIFIYEVYPEDERLNMFSEGRKATIRDFYGKHAFTDMITDLTCLLKNPKLTGIILPSLKRLHSDLVEQEATCISTLKIDTKKNLYGQGNRQVATVREREDECGICLVPTTKMVLPGCCHEMCINCYRNWNTRSESCPFCRKGLRRVKSEDLWVLTNESEVIDAETVSKEEVSRFYHYIQSLPNIKDTQETSFWVFYDYLI